MTTPPPRSPIDFDGHGTQTAVTRKRGPIGWLILRVGIAVFGLFSLAYWGYISWAFPMPGAFFAVGAPLFAVLLWYLFRSDSSPLGADLVGKVIVEVALVIAAAGSWLSIGHPLVGLVFVVLAAVSGIVTFRRETSNG